MHDLDQAPTPPDIPQFSARLEHSLRAQVRPQPIHSPRRRTIAAVGAAAVVVAVGVAVVASSDNGPTNSPRIQPSGSGPDHLRLAAFSVVTQPSGAVTMTVNQQQLSDPTALRRALAKAGVPALVTVGSVCSGPGPDNELPQIISRPQPQPDGSIATTITPSAIPTGMKLSFGLYSVPRGSGLYVSVVPEHASLTCTSNPSAPPGGTPNSH